MPSTTTKKQIQTTTTNKPRLKPSGYCVTISNKGLLPLQIYSNQNKVLTITK